MKIRKEELKKIIKEVIVEKNKEQIEESIYPGDLGRGREGLAEVWRKTVSVGKKKIVILATTADYSIGSTGGVYAYITVSVYEGSVSKGGLILYSNGHKDVEAAEKDLKTQKVSLK